MPQHGAGMACLAVRSFLLSWCHRRLLAAVVFLDVKAAFDSLDRSLLLEDGGILSRSGLSSHLLQLLRDPHSGTWFHMRGDHCIVQTDRGVKQGDPIGDVAWNYFQGATLREVYGLLRDASLSCYIPNEGST